jgi:hypothetical protein
MNVTYCRGWFRAEKRATALLSHEAGEQAHKTGNLYTALIGDPTRPLAFVDVRLVTGFVGVGFLDAELREYLAYDFQVATNGQMFLVGATVREFEQSSDKACRATIYKFSQNGHVDILRLEGGKQQEAETTTDVSGNWEPIPSFGDYESITRRERGGSIRMEPTTMRA